MAIGMGRLAAALLGASTLLTPATDARTSSVSPFEGADPDIERLVIPGENGGKPLWVVYVTGMRVFTSADLVTWRDRGVMLDIRDPRRNDVPWLVEGRARRGLWAPDMVVANGRYHLFYSVGPNDFSSEVAVAVCSSPLPPCKDANGAAGPLPVAKQARFEAIDPMVFRDPKDGTHYMYLGGSAGARLRVFRLGADLTSIASEVADVPQPHAFTEGAFMHTRIRNGIRTYYLSYSNGSYNRSNYNVKYVTGPTALGPWSAPRTILAATSRFKGPGHHAIIHDAKMGWLLAYHRWEGRAGDGPYRASEPGGGRRTAFARLRYKGAEIEPVDMVADAAPRLR